MNIFRISNSIASLVLSAFFAWGSQAGACSCAGTLPPNQEMAEANAVFTGKVIKLTKIGSSKEHPDFFMSYDVTIQVAAVIKGKALKHKAGKNITIHTGSGGGDCGYPFEEGEQYLVYAFGTTSDLATNICTRTQPLKGAENEVLELEGRLPKIRFSPRPPELLLKGTINDAGYRGYVFELRNYLHERIFYGPLLVQVLRDGRWEDYPVNLGIGPREEPSREDAAKMLSTERTQTAQDETERVGLRGISYLGRASATALFAALQSQSHPWRVGFRYESEWAVDAGKKLSKSHRLVWGPQIEASIETRKLTFEEAFRDTGMIPDPLGTNSTGPSTEPK